MTKPQGYMYAAEEQLFGLFTLCLPYWQTLLFAGMSGTISFVLLTCLLLFVVHRSPAIYRGMTIRLKDWAASWAPTPDRRDRWVWVHLLVTASGPSITRPGCRFIG